MLMTTLQVPELRKGKELLRLPQGRVGTGDHPCPLPLHLPLWGESASAPGSV